MSLLMDALKKAEQEKKKAAEAAVGGADGAPALTDADLNRAFEERAWEDPDKTAQNPRTAGLIAGQSQDAEPSTTEVVAAQLGEVTFPNEAELSLEPLDATRSTGEITAPQKMRETKTDDTTRPTALKLDQTGAGSMSTSGEVRPSAAQARTGVKPSFDKDATLPSERQIRSSLKDYFDSSQSLETAGLDITDTGERLRRGSAGVEAGDRTTRVAADAVFAASRRSASPFYMWLIGAAAVLLLLMAVGLYFEMSMPDRVTPVIAERPKPAVAPPPATTVAKTETAPVAPVPTAAPAAPTPAPKAETTPQVTAEPAKLAANPNDAIIPPTTITEPAAPAIEPEIPTDLSSTGLGSPARAADRPRFRVAQSPVKITRSTVRDSAIDDINEAYRAFQGGNDARAERLYRSVLTRYPDRRDALLGLAAIAVRQGNKDRAYQAYRRVLQLNPQDPVASAALFSLHSGPDSEMNESKLKLLLDQKSKSPQVLFSLGNYYAKQSRWAEAQQAYFDAYAGDSRNPDYAFNLAVSLERIGQGNTALTYYRKALEHADQRAGGFNTAQALARIGALSAAN